MPLFSPEDLSCVAIGKSHSLKYPYAPFRIDGLQSFQRADLGVTLVGSKVSVWADRSGKGHDLSQGTDANRATWVDNVIGGRPVLRPGTNVFMTNTAWGPGTIASVYAVIRNVTGAGAYQNFHDVDNDVPNLYVAGDGLERPLCYPGTVRARWSADLVTATPYLVKWAWDTSGATNSTYYTQVNAATEVSETVADSLNAGNIDTLWLDPGIAAQPMLGDLAERVIYNRLLGIEQVWLRVYTASRYLQPTFNQ